MNTPLVLTVSQVNTYIKSIIDSDINLNTVFMVGEISNFSNHYSSGHWYLTLKDNKAQIKAVMFKGSNSRIRFLPENGMSVIVRGRISVFERDGVYQLYIDDMQPDGAGALSVAFEQLKKKLEKEGLFAQAHKKPIPEIPLKVGVVTSSTGAAFRDIVNVCARRFPLAEIILYPTQVQGEYAPGEIAAAIDSFSQTKCADVLIVGRGGGSVEDLWAFNEEIVARAIYNCAIPVISAVGHETDFTISDFVADLRAPTPSAAAEIAVPDWREHARVINNSLQSITNVLEAKIDSERSKIKILENSRALRDITSLLDVYKLGIDSLCTRMNTVVNELVNRNSSALSSICARLDALSPLKVLGRGYALVGDGERTINSIEQVEIGQSIKIKVFDGTIHAGVQRKE